MDDLLARDASDQIAALNARRVSSVELLKAELARHEQTHARLNAVVAVDLDRALDRARAIDDLRDRGEAVGLLAGLPMTVKDTLDVVGMPASSGLAALRRRQARDAAAVANAKAAGAVVWDKTNTPVMAGDWQTFNALYGTSNNPGPSRGRPADRPAGRPRPWPPASPRWRSARTSADRCAFRPASAACSATSRPGVWSTSTATCRPVRGRGARATSM